jgi:hypothetical protein
MVLASLWIFTDAFSADYMFYAFFLLGLLLAATLIQLYSCKYDHIMHANQQNFDQLLPYMDFYLEEVCRLLLESERDESCKSRLLVILCYH